MWSRTRLAVTAVAVLASAGTIGATIAVWDRDTRAHVADAGLPHVSETKAMATADTAGVLPSAATRTPAWKRYAHKPNILMITSDDMASEDLRYMPHVKRLLEKQGVTFKNAVAPTPICVPARASLMSGQYAHNHGAVTISGPHGGYKAFSERRTVPIALRRAGYDTLFTGKYINGYGENGKSHEVPPGWTDWRGTVDPSTYNYVAPIVNHNGKLTRYHRYTTNVMTDQATQMLTQKRRKHHPWFMWVNYVAPHAGGPREADDPTVLYAGRPAGKIGTPVPAPQDKKKYRKLGLPKRPDMFKVPKAAPKDSPSRRHWSPLRRKALAISHRQRVQSLQAVDRGVAKQIRTLRRTHQLKRTIVVFASDNGYAVGEHNISGKLWFYDDIEQIPVLMRGPRIPRGRTVATAITNPDIAATILAAASAKPLRKLDGVNILPWIKAPTQNRVVPVEGWPVHNGSKRLYVGVRTDTWTYVHIRSGGEELYNRKTDPYELHSLAKDARYRSQLRALRQLTAAYEDCRGSSCPKRFYRT